MSQTNTPKTDSLLKIAPYIVYTILAILSLNHVFFFDTIQLSSSHALHYYNTGFSQLLLPDNIDSGHPPVMGMALAALWKLFGMKLWVGHLFIFFWVVMLIWQTQRLISIWFEGRMASLISLVLLLDATTLAQSVLVSPDVILMACFVAALRYVILNNRVKLLLVVLPLTLISMRGMATAFALFVFDVFLNYNNSSTKIQIGRIIRNALVFAPGVVLFLLFFAYHYQVKGWAAYHPDSPWADCFRKIDSASQFFRNLALLGWRFLDFGRVAIWGCSGIVVYTLYKKRLLRWTEFNQSERLLLIPATVLLLFYIYSAGFHVSLVAHRYFMPLYFMVALAMFLAMKRIWNERKRTIFSIGIICVLLSGNFWVYPERVATGWDATLAHWPYYGLRDDLMNYLTENRLSGEKIGGGFGFEGNQQKVDLQETDFSFYPLSDPECRYVVYSNLSNLPDESIDEIVSSGRWSLVKRFEKGAVFISLYKKNDSGK